MNNQSLRKKPYLVLTRPEPGLSETAYKVSALGWQPLLMPVMTIQPLTVDYLDVSAIQAIVFTSRQAIAPTIQQLAKQHIDYRCFPVFTVGDITAQDAQKAGFTNILSANKDAVALAALIKDKLSSDAGQLLFPFAKGQGQLLYALLKQAGFSALQYEVYQAIPVQTLSDEFLDKLQSETINSILFFSSETARFFIELLPEHLWKYLKTIQAVGISQKTKGVLERVSWKRIDIARHPNTEEMLFLLKEHF
ncbi:Uroporphyrinogen-III synthase [Commensalibacter intestini A911]|uniref:Uroporphyrinogen-III synthase n=2 Tax=Commensalibacter intestini TaxID=479936 RepID=A0A251ZWT4_9PROT|nr:uroporphyrinogen-III synthase [Commensalibacter intestini]EHD13765.1 Uroporphyrinogen-III synthase [Commensalibacter intestini A911]OUI79138.1 hypothetical protein HK18_04360 [Commensalibacter intestini]